MDDLTAELLDRAGVAAAEVVSVAEMPAVGYMNRHLLLSLGDGRRLVARRYGWPWGTPGEPVPRMEKELALLAHFEAHGAPTPRAVAGVRRDADTAALLLVHEPGRLLADRAGDPAAWRAAGAALRRIHDLPLPPALAAAAGAGLVDDRLGLAAGSSTWGEWHLDNTRRHAEEARISPAQRARAVALAEHLRPVLDAAPRRLIHADANPWNVLVDAGSGRAVWLDWEFAWFADPSYDFVRMDHARQTDIGPAPAAFFAGYGVDRPPQPLHDFYTLGFMLWMHNERRHVSRRMHSYAVADAYVAALDAHLDALERAAGA